MINTLVLLNGSEVTDFKTFRVVKAVGDANISSNFEGRLDNFAGYQVGKYNVGDNIKVYAASGEPWVYTYSEQQSYSNLGSNLIGSQLVGSTINSSYDSGLVAYWKMNDVIGSTVTAFIGSNLLASGIANGSNTGIMGSCWGVGSSTSAGIGRISATDNTLYLGTSGVTTVSLWFKSNVINTSEGAFLIAKPNNYTDSNANQWAIWQDPTGSLVGWTYLSDNRQRLFCGSSNLLWNGSWNHVGYQFGISGMKLWINGSNWATAIGSTQNAGAGTNKPLTIGTNYRESQSRWQSFFSGLIDDVRIYNYPVSDATMVSIYNSGVPVEYFSGTTVTNNYFYDYSQTLSGTYITQTGSSIIGSQIYNSGSVLITSGTYDSGLKYYYKFNESGLSTLDSINNTIGSVVIGYTLTNGYTGLGSCFGFNGSGQAIYVADTGSFLGSVSSTVCGWIKMPPGNSRGAFFKIGSADTNGWGVGVSSNADEFAVPGSKLTVLKESVGWYNPNYTLSGNMWYHIALVADNGAPVVYVNGSFIGSSTADMRSPSTWALNIGGYANAGRYFSGLIDDVRAFNYKLPLGSIQAIYASGNPTEYASGAGTYAYNSGITVYDYANVYTGSVSLIGSSLIGSQTITGSIFYNYDYSYVGSISVVNGSTFGTKIFNGLIEDIEYEGEGTKENVTILGRDYTARLMDRTVEPEVYTNLTPGSIVKDIINKYTQDITTSGVSVAGSTISRISFIHVPVYDAVKQLADISNYTFYVDNNQDLKFGQANGSSSGYTLDSTNVYTGGFTERRDTVYNQVWVYGDRYLDGYRQTFTAGSPVNGSVFTLLYNPHNTEIFSGLSGSQIQPGAILNMSESTGSNVKYLVDYDSKQIIFTSGTSQGNNVPVSGNVFTVNYKRLLPIVKVGDDESSKAKYGTRVKIITDKTIKDPRTASLLMQSELANSSEPILEGNVDIDGIAFLDPGNTCIANFPHNDINNETYDIIQVTYDFNKENCLHDRVVSAKLNKKLPDLTDQIKDILLELKKLRSQDISDADLITRFQTNTGSMGIRMSGCLVYTRSIGGSNLILDSPVFGKLDIYKYYSPVGLAFVLGNNAQGILGAQTLGGSLGVWNLYYSGGYF